MSQSTGSASAAAPTDHADKSVLKFVKDNGGPLAEDLQRQAEDALARAAAAAEVQPVSQRFQEQCAAAAAKLAQAAALVAEAETGIFPVDNADDVARLRDGDMVHGSAAVQARADYRHVQ